MPLCDAHVAAEPTWPLCDALQVLTRQASERTHRVAFVQHHHLHKTLSLMIPIDSSHERWIPLRCQAAAFGSCSAASSAGCPAGYVCKGAICMPTAATTATFQHDSGFATRLAHAVAMQVEAA